MTILYEESSDAYHSNAALGSTDIRDFIRSPRLFKDRQDGLAQKDTPALLFGTASHMALLEPRRFASEVVMKPEGMSFATTEGKQWRAAQAGKLIVKAEDHVHLHYMHDRMPSEVRMMIGHSKHEVTVRRPWGDTGVTAQCRLDIWDTEGHIADLKTIDDIDNVERAIWTHGYHIQKRVYQRIVETETGVRQAFKLVFAEKAPPYRWRVVELDADYDAIADEAIDGALHGISARIKSGCWDDPADLHLIASPPAWLTEHLDEE